LTALQGSAASLIERILRHAVDQELSVRQAALVGAEERLAGDVEQVRREVFRLGRAQQALFAYIDTLTKTLLTCVPEPPPKRKPRPLRGQGSDMNVS